MAPDPSVSRTSYRRAQEQPPIVPSNVTGPPPAPGPAVSGDNPSDAVPPLDPLPNLTPEQPETYDAAIEAAMPEPTPGVSEREPYGLGKRFLRGYPTLIEWFPRHLGPPRKSNEPEGETFARG